MEVVVRPAQARDRAARAALLRRALASHRRDAFLFFYFQELTLQLCVLSAAVLFIFFGASLCACALVPVAGAALAAGGAALAHRALARKHAQRLLGETAGFVAEYRGPLPAPPPRGAVRVRPAPPGAERVRPAPPGAERVRPAPPGAERLVGTVSVSEFWGPRDSGWLHLLAVDPDWQRRGVGRALVSACRSSGAARGLESLEAALSELQAPARALLHAAGWQTRGTYHRRLLGAALTLPVARLGLDLPYA